MAGERSKAEHAAYMREWRKQHPEEFRASKREWSKAERDRKAHPCAWCGQRAVKSVLCRTCAIRAATGSPTPSELEEGARASYQQ